MRKLLFILAVFIMIVSISACNKDKEQAKTGEQQAESNPEAQTTEHHTQPRQDDQPVNTNSIEEPEESIPMKNFLASKGLGIGQSVVFYVREDLDGDGHDEIVVAMGIVVDDYNEVYILRLKDGKFVLLGDNQNNDGYGIYSIEVVQLEEHNDKVILFGLTNTANMLGFKLVAINGDSLIPLVYSAAASGVGDDYLVDGNHNGQYEGYVQHRYSYDVLYYPVTRTFTLVDGKFKKSNLSVELPQYPEDPRGLVQEFLALGVIVEELPPNVVERLSALCMWCLSDDWIVSGIDSHSPVFDLIMGIDDRIYMEIEESDGMAIATLTQHRDDGSINKTVFQLMKINARWTITGFGTEITNIDG